MDRGSQIRRNTVGSSSAYLVALLLLLGVVSEASAGQRHKHKITPQPLPPTVIPPPGSPPPAVFGFPPASYRPGWYGTHYWPHVNNFHGFYGDYWQTGYFPGY
jgi:hypothetical protein